MTWACILAEDYKDKKHKEGKDPYTEWEKE
jgi:hypothetical protein